MRDAPGETRLVVMNTSTLTQRLILDAAIDRSVIHGTLTAPYGDRRDFHGWLELNTALEATLDRRADRALCENPAASVAVRASAGDTRPAAAAVSTVKAPAGRSGTQAARRGR